MSRTNWRDQLPSMKWFRSWHSLFDVEQKLWRTVDKLEEVAGGHFARHAERTHSQLRDEVLPTVQFAKKLCSLPNHWDQSIELRFCLDNGKGGEVEFDAEYRWHSLQPNFKASSLGRIEVTRVGVEFKKDKDRDFAWQKAETPEEHLALVHAKDSETWPLIRQEMLDSVNKKLANKRYSENTALLLYVDCDESCNSINWIRHHDQNFFSSLCDQTRGSFSHLFAWGPSSGVFFKDLTKPSASH
ncbi:hypothetical protein O2N63_00225 [Aliiroseovarius sp. KMU-50]|uniref:DUF695 domain-containing protein n=1 Tax=Aliiroseovarius salicola TaxID=3009082 RepID=A0ABT4VW85_9RHOB|nr:hypothetical protein [Aliiroseovarius sp. KMU-50]MDA5092514.1 hypothetical protein [Aliiroseovarius sp. KMU-50]